MMSPEAHSEHMAKVEQGLQAILQSEDINEIKQIAQALLTEEEGEQAQEQPNKSFEQKYAEAAAQEQGAQ